MNNLNTHKKSLLIGIGVILILILGAFLYYLDSQSKKTPPLEVQTKQLSKSTTPVGLPANLPMSTGDKVLQNYESVTNDGRVQSTKQIITKGESREVLEKYIEFFKSIGYIGGFSEVASKEGGQQIAQMEKNGDLLTIVALTDANKKTSVEFTVIQKK